MAQKQDDSEASPPTLLTGPLVWTSEHHSILVNDQKVAIKGINWFGFGTLMACVGGGGGREGVISPLA
jgi:hypothetical protein